MPRNIRSWHFSNLLENLIRLVESSLCKTRHSFCFFKNELFLNKIQPVENSTYMIKYCLRGREGQRAIATIIPYHAGLHFMVACKEDVLDVIFRLQILQKLAVTDMIFPIFTEQEQWLGAFTTWECPRCQNSVLTYLHNDLLLLLPPAYMN